ncbi:MAG: hypothetical protein M0Q95_09645 [Porticoccaceae bacterium]|nr:hypothetical protein [Porticoccaceae bacterium]
MSLKLLFSTAAIIITFAAFVPYVLATLSGKTKPHVFSWVIWGTTTFIVFFAQLDAKGGMGAWPIGVSGAIAIVIAVIALAKKTDTSITPLDWLFFISALLSLPFWYLTSDPTWAVIILTTVDLLGFGPTIRKAYAFPQDENLMFFGLVVARNVLGIMALEHYSVATVLFPLSVMLACIGLIVMITHRRNILST